MRQNAARSDRIAVMLMQAAATLDGRLAQQLAARVAQRLAALSELRAARARFLSCLTSVWSARLVPLRQELRQTAKVKHGQKLSGNEKRKPTCATRLQQTKKSQTRQSHLALLSRGS